MAEIAQIESQINNLTHSREVLLQRIKLLKAVDPERILSENIRQCNRYINGCASHAGSGIRGIADSFSQDVAAGKESYEASYNLQTAAYNIGREIARCQNRLADLNSQIQVKDSQLREARKKEQEQKEKQTGSEG